MTVIDRRYGVADGIAVKAPCRASTTANITLSGLQTIDGIALAADDRVLVKNQTTGSENGIYAASSGNWLRTADFDGAYDVVTGTRIYVTSGTIGARLEYAVTTTGTITIGTTSISFSLIAGSTAPVSVAMMPVVAASTLQAARVAFGLDSYGTRDDGTNYYPNSAISTVSTNQVIAAASHLTRYIATGPINFTLPVASTFWNGFGFWIEAVTGDITLVPDATNTISGAIAAGTNFTIPAGAKVFITTNAAASGLWYVEGFPFLLGNVKRINTTPYTVTAADNGRILSFYGAAFQRVNFPAGSTLPTDFRCYIYNEETTAVGKGIGGLDVGSFTLYPTQGYHVQNANNAMKLVGGIMPYKVSSIALFCNASLGSDDRLVADGLAAGARALATQNASRQQLYRDFNHNGSQPTVTLTGTYTESVTFGGQPVNCGVFFWSGSAPGAYIAKPTNSGSPFCFIVGDGATLEMTNVTLDGNSLNAVGIQLHQNVVLDLLTGISFGAFGTGTHIASDGAGWTLNINNSYAVTGGATTHLGMVGGGVINHTGGVTVTTTGSPTIGTWFKATGSVLYALGSSITWTGGPAVGCQKWAMGPQAAISLSGNAANVPGSVAGAPATGSAPAAATGWATA